MLYRDIKSKIHSTNSNKKESSPTEKIEEKLEWLKRQVASNRGNLTRPAETPKIAKKPVKELESSKKGSLRTLAIASPSEFFYSRKVKETPKGPKSFGLVDKAGRQADNEIVSSRAETMPSRS